MPCRRWVWPESFLLCALLSRQLRLEEIFVVQRIAGEIHLRRQRRIERRIDFEMNMGRPNPVADRDVGSWFDRSETVRAVVTDLDPSVALKIEI